MKQSSIERTEKLINEALGRLLCVLRTTSKISQGDIGKIIGIHQTAVSRIEKGRQALTPTQVHAIAHNLQLDVQRIFFEYFNDAIKYKNKVDADKLEELAVSLYLRDDDRERALENLKVRDQKSREKKSAKVAS